MSAIGSCVEMFCTDSKNDWEWYDQIYIVRSAGRYILEVEERDYCVHAYDIDTCCEKSPTYVDRFIFDMIVDGLNKMGFKRCHITLGE